MRPFHPIYNPWDLPFSSGGWRCDLCDHKLAQGDNLGRYEGPVFRILGYQCPACGHEVRKEWVLDKFNWKMFAAGRCSCQ